MAKTPNTPDTGLTRTRIVGPSPDALPLMHPPAPLPERPPPISARSPDAKRSRRTIASPHRSTQRSDRLVVWVVLLAILAIALLPLLIDLRRPSVIIPSEEQALAASTETWQRQLEMSAATWFGDRLIPILGGESVLDVPPGTTWLHLLALQTIEPDNATPQRIAFRARWVSVIAALVAIAGVFWAGYAIGGLNPGALSALVVASCPAFIHYGRLATPDMPTLALSIVSVAAALWAMRPHRRPPSRGRQGLGYAVCGLALGGTALVGGVTAIPPVFLPLVLIGVLAPQRAAHTTGLFAAGGLAALVVFPWIAMTHSQHPDTWMRWLEALTARDWEEGGEFFRVIGLRVLLILIAVLPWTMWLVFAIAQPFSTSSVGWRSRMFVGWAWFITVFVMLITSPGGDALNELLLALPAAAVLIGQLFRRLIDLSSEGRHARLWRLGRWPTLGLLLVLSVGVPLTLALQQPLIDRQWLAGMIAYPTHWVYHVLGGALLVSLSLLSLRFALRQYPGKALVCWAVWSIMMVSYIAMPISRGPLLNPSDAGDWSRQQILPLGKADAPTDGSGSVTSASLTASFRIHA